MVKWCGGQESTFRNMTKKSESEDGPFKRAERDDSTAKVRCTGYIEGRPQKADFAYVTGSYWGGI